MLTFIATPAFCQNSKILLTGTLVMSTGETFPYRLSIRDSAGTAKGYAYTFAAPNDTKATIRGAIDKQRHTLTFSETGIISSHDTHTKAFMCLIHASLKYEKDEHTGKKSLWGSITGVEADNTTCTGGVVIFDNDDEIQYLFSNHIHSDTVIEMGPRNKEAPHRPKTDTVVTAEPAPLEKITAGQERIYDWRSDSVVIELWDGSTVDGDLVTLTYNSVEYLHRYFLAKRKNRLVLPVTGIELNIIAITANNEGSEPPNTANISIYDGNTRYDLLSYNNTGQTSLIKIKRVGGKK